jgi:2'-5' RNA ligase
VRTFIAIEMAEGIRKQLADAQERLRAAGGSVKWVKPDQMHLTLRFLGEIEESAVDPVAEAIAAAASGVQPFEAAVVGLGSFPPQGAPRVVWVGVRDAGPLVPLQKRLEEELERRGFGREDHPFTPHLTLGRVKDPRGARELRAAVDAQRETPFGAQTIEEILLIQSVLSPGGPAYTPLRRHRL